MASNAPPGVVDGAAVYDGGGVDRDASDRLLAAEAMSALSSGLGLTHVSPDQLELTSENVHFGEYSQRDRQRNMNLLYEAATENSTQGLKLVTDAVKEMNCMSSEQETHAGQQERHASRKFGSGINNQSMFDTIHNLSNSTNNVVLERLTDPNVVICAESGTKLINYPSRDVFDASYVLESFKQGKRKIKRTKEEREERREAKRKKREKREAKLRELIQDGGNAELIQKHMARDETKKCKKKRSADLNSVVGVDPSMTDVPSATNGSTATTESRVPNTTTHTCEPTLMEPKYISGQPVYHPPGLYRPTEFVPHVIYRNYGKDASQPSALIQALQTAPQHTYLLQPRSSQPSQAMEPVSKVMSSDTTHPAIKVSASRNDEQDLPLNLSLHNREGDCVLLPPGSHDSTQSMLNYSTRNVISDTVKIASEIPENSMEQVFIGVKSMQVAHVNPYVNAPIDETKRISDKAARKLKKKRKKEKLARKLERENAKLNIASNVLPNTTGENGDLGHGHKPHKSKHKKKKRSKGEVISETVKSVAKDQVFGGLVNTIPKLTVCSNSGIINVPQAVVHPTVVTSAQTSPRFFMIPTNTHDTNKHSILAGADYSFTCDVKVAHAPHTPVISEIQPLLTNESRIPSFVHSTDPIRSTYLTGASGSTSDSSQPLLTLKTTSQTLPSINQSTHQQMHRPHMSIPTLSRSTNPAIHRLSESVLHLISSRNYADKDYQHPTLPRVVSSPATPVNVDMCKEEQRPFDTASGEVTNDVLSHLSPTKTEPMDRSTTPMLPFKKRKLEQYRSEVPLDIAHGPDTITDTVTVATEEPRFEINPADSLQCLEENTLLVRPDEDGDIPLHIAVARENLDAVKDYLRLMRQAGCDIDVLNSDRQTPLHIAVVTNQTECVKCLLEAGADIQVASSRGATSLHLAVTYADLNIISALLTHKSASQCLSFRDFDGFSVLHVAVNTKKLDVVKLLLPHVTDVNIKDGKSGRSALFHAVENGQEEMVSLLLRHYANANVTNYAGSTPLVAASGRGFYNIAISLVSHGAETKGYDFVDACRGTGQNLSQMIMMQPGIGMATLKRKLESVKHSCTKKPVANGSEDSVGGSKVYRRDNSPTDSMSEDGSAGQRTLPSNSSSLDDLSGSHSNNLSTDVTDYVKLYKTFNIGSNKEISVPMSDSPGSGKVMSGENSDHSEERVAEEKYLNKNETNESEFMKNPKDNIDENVDTSEDNGERKGIAEESNSEKSGENIEDDEFERGSNMPGRRDNEGGEASDESDVDEAREKDILALGVDGDVVVKNDFNASLRQEVKVCGNGKRILTTSMSVVGSLTVDSVGVSGARRCGDMNVVMTSDCQKFDGSVNEGDNKEYKQVGSPSTRIFVDDRALSSVSALLCVDRTSAQDESALENSNLQNREFKTLQRGDSGGFSVSENVTEGLEGTVTGAVESDRRNNTRDENLLLVEGCDGIDTCDTEGVAVNSGPRGEVEGGDQRNEMESTTDDDTILTENAGKLKNENIGKLKNISYKNKTGGVVNSSELEIMGKCGGKQETDKFGDMCEHTGKCEANCNIVEGLEKSQGGSRTADDIVSEKCEIQLDQIRTMKVNVSTASETTAGRVGEFDVNEAIAMESRIKDELENAVSEAENRRIEEAILHVKKQESGLRVETTAAHGSCGDAWFSTRSLVDQLVEIEQAQRSEIRQLDVIAKKVQLEKRKLMHNRVWLYYRRRERHLKMSALLDVMLSYLRVIEESLTGRYGARDDGDSKLDIRRNLQVLAAVLSGKNRDLIDKLQTIPDLATMKTFLHKLTAEGTMNELCLTLKSKLSTVPRFMALFEGKKLKTYIAVVKSQGAEHSDPSRVGVCDAVSGVCGTGTTNHGVMGICGSTTDVSSSEVSDARRADTKEACHGSWSEVCSDDIKHACDSTTLNDKTGELCATPESHRVNSSLVNPSSGVCSLQQLSRRVASGHLYNGLTALHAMFQLESKVSLGENVGPSKLLTGGSSPKLINRRSNSLVTSGDSEIDVISREFECSNRGDVT